MFGGLELKYYFCSVNHKNREPQTHKSTNVYLWIYDFLY